MISGDCVDRAVRRDADIRDEWGLMSIIVIIDDPVTNRNIFAIPRRTRRRKSYGGYPLARAPMVRAQGAYGRDRLIGAPWWPRRSRSPGLCRRKSAAARPTARMARWCRRRW